jgi:hypothetical protein
VAGVRVGELVRWASLVARSSQTTAGGHRNGQEQEQVSWKKEVWTGNGGMCQLGKKDKRSGARHLSRKGRSCATRLRLSWADDHCGC